MIQLGLIWLRFPHFSCQCATALGMCCYIAAADLEVTAPGCHPARGHPGAAMPPALSPQCQSSLELSWSRGTGT